MSEAQTADASSLNEKMEDGGNAPLPASGREKVAKKDYDTETGTLSVIFKTGDSREVKLGDLPEQIVTQLAMHGLARSSATRTQT